MKFYKAIYTKDPIQKKRKKFEDGFIQIDEATKKILLFSEDGKQVSSVPKGTLVEDRDRGCEYCFVGGFYVELDYEVPEKEFLSGKAFVAEQPVQKEMIAVVKPKFQKLISEKSGGIAKKSTSTEPKSKIRDPEELRSRSRALDDQRQKLKSAEEAEEVILEVGDGPAVVKKIVIEGFLAKRMMRHQIEGVRWLVKRLSGTEEGQRSLGCIFADSMGLGKTLTVIATMFTLLRQSPFEGEGGLVRKCLVVAPLSLVFNWVFAVKKLPRCC